MADLVPFSGITRIQPFTGLVIDPPTWGTAHDEYRLRQRLHLLSLHGSGIAQGLAVLPTDPPSDSVLIEPGVAVDADGEMIVVAERERVAIDGRLGNAFVTLAYQEHAPDGADSAAGDDQEARGRVVEGYRLELLDAPPKGPALELARIAIAADAPLAIAAPRDVWAPGGNEIDSRFRPQLGGPTPRALRVALVAEDPPDELAAGHLEGFSHLLDACTLAGLRVSAQFSSDGDLPDADLFYVTGRADAAPSAALLDGLRERHLQGSWLFADACGSGDAFAESLGPVIGDETAEGTRAAETEARVNGAFHVFSSPPDGACDGDLQWGPQALLSGRDFGCAWRGRSNGDALPRSQIRDALEFGVNIAVCAGGYARAR